MSLPVVAPAAKTALSGPGLRQMIGFGTHELAGSECYLAVRAALEAGVRHIDSAESYRNAAEVGRAMLESKVPRESIYLATKLSTTNLDEGAAYAALQAELDGFWPAAYADLCYLHFPSDDSLPSWRALERLHDEGRCRQLGLSNFGQAQIEELVRQARVKPAALQIQFSVYEPCSPAFLRWLRGQGIAVVAASSLNPNATCNLNPMQDPHVVAIASKHGRTTAQVLLRWLLQQNVAVLPRSRSTEHIRQNSQLDFTLSDGEVAVLGALSTLLQSRPGFLRPDGASDLFGVAS